MKGSFRQRLNSQICAQNTFEVYHIRMNDAKQNDRSFIFRETTPEKKKDIALNIRFWQCPFHYSFPICR
ncbi:hypothetical protein BSM4216_0668 [Bacillus smithii]|nr:hypothetical protein BSM4216_0668 [Bacillus smithii]